MKLYKPLWISHDGQAIFSVDIHPDGSRFATAGQGDGGNNGKVIVWNMRPLLNEEDENNEEVPKALSIMDGHQACVNIVRWSRSGRYLASGGDDRFIMIWQFAGYGLAGGFGSKIKVKKNCGERWKCSYTLKGHSGDVLGLEWSPYDRWLASCSVDNTVVIWDAQNFPQVVQVLRDHTSLVKGVTWDPIGSYIASQSDDKTIRIWKTLDWKLEKTVTKPFEESHASTHVLRLSWSPDGGYLVSAHAMNNAGPTAQIIERNGWQTSLDFVGHRKAITSTRFNGCLFHRLSSGVKKIEDEDELKLEPYACCAIGSRDRSISVWLTSLKRPLVVIRDLFDDSIMDISWSFSGYSMLCCSWDGTIAYFNFTPEELGHNLTQEQKSNFNRKLYGKASFAIDKPLVIENPAMLSMQEQNKEPSKHKSDPPRNQSVYRSPQKYPTKQIETRTATGRRHITPVFVAPHEALGVIPRPFGSDAFQNILNRSKTVEEEDKLEADVEEVVDEDSPQSSPSVTINTTKTNGDAKLLKPTSNHVTSSKTLERNEAHGKTNGEHPSSSMMEVEEHPNQKKKAVLDGRLITKTKPNDSENKNSNSKSKSLPSSKDQLLSGKSRGVKTPTNQTDAQSPRRPGRPPQSLKRKIASSTSTSDGSGKKSKKQDLILSTPTTNQTSSKRKTAEQSTNHVTETTINTQPSCQTFQERFLPALKLESKVWSQININKKLVSVSCDNQLPQNSSKRLHQLICRHGDQEIWSAAFSSPFLAISISKQIVGVALFDGSLCALSLQSGRRLLPTLCRNSRIAGIHVTRQNLMAVDVTCGVTVWDVKRQRTTIENCSFAHLLPTDIGSETGSCLRHFSLTDQGTPLITFADHRSFAYSSKLTSWTPVSLPHDILEKYSQPSSQLLGTNNQNSTPDTDDPHDFNHLKMVIDSFSACIQPGSGTQASQSYRGIVSAQRDATVAVLEQKVNRCETLESSIEYRRWLLAYVRFLVSENLQERLREVCNDLIGPPFQSSKSNSQSKRTNGIWQPHIMGMEKRLLLRDEVLPIVASNLSFQRIYSDYYEQLQNVIQLDS